MKYVFLRKKTRASPRMHIFWLFSAKSFKINHICETTDVFEQESKLVCLEAYLDSLQRPISQNIFNSQRLPTIFWNLSIIHVSNEARYFSESKRIFCILSLLYFCYFVYPLFLLFTLIYLDIIGEKNAIHGCLKERITCPNRF